VIRPAWEGLGLDPAEAGAELALLRLLLALRPWLEAPEDAAGLRQALAGETGALRLKDLRPSDPEDRVDPAAYKELLGWLVRLEGLLHPKGAGLGERAARWARVAEECGYRLAGILAGLDA
jgi:hypothetical protein